MHVVELHFDNHQVSISGGELISYLVDDYEVIHQKGSPGWRNADTEMFPIIGPTAEANFKVQTPRGPATQDQHGLLRELDYLAIAQSETKAVFEKVYIANSPVKNSKFPVKSRAEFLSWPYDFRFRKTYELDVNGLTVSFSVSGEEGMPFMLGYHPAFKLVTDTPTIEPCGETVISLAEVLEVGNRALEVQNCSEITLHDKRSVKLKSTGFRHFMCWTEVPNMVCLEPITFYPYDVEQKNLHEGFSVVAEQEQRFSLQIQFL